MVIKEWRCKQRLNFKTSRFDQNFCFSEHARGQLNYDRTISLQKRLWHNILQRLFLILFTTPKIACSEELADENKTIETPHLSTLAIDLDSSRVTKLMDVWGGNVLLLEGQLCPLIVSCLYFSRDHSPLSNVWVVYWVTPVNPSPPTDGNGLRPA